MGQNRPRRVLTRLLAALALAIQVFVIQPHVDGLAFAGSNAAQSVSAVGKQEAVACLICEAAVSAQNGITPAPPAIAPLETTLVLANPAPALPVSETRPSLPWQSRAPPISA